MFVHCSHPNNVGVTPQSLIGSDVLKVLMDQLRWSRSEIAG